MKNYEKLYKEALERARKMYNSAKEKSCILDCKNFEEIFPELKESEDERIRKELIYALKFANQKGVYDKHIGWLEKQGEKPIWTDDDRIMAFTLLRDVDQMTYISNEEKNERFEWLNSLEDKFNK